MRIASPEEFVATGSRVASVAINLVVTRVLKKVYETTTDESDSLKARVVEAFFDGAPLGLVLWKALLYL